MLRGGSEEERKVRCTGECGFDLSVAYKKQRAHFRRALPAAAIKRSESSGRQTKSIHIDFTLLCTAGM